MVSNYDRIYTEIRNEAHRLAKSSALSHDTLMKLAMELVYLEDQHRRKPIHNINQKVVTAIRAVTSQLSDLDVTEDHSSAEVP